jgi:hypothetical protein
MILSIDDREFLSEENGKDKSTRYRFGQEAIEGHTEISEEVNDEKAHSQ